MIDTHSHMYSEQFNEDRAAAINRSQQQGIEFILLPNIDVDSIDALHSLADTQKNCLPMMGLHPCSVDENVIKSLSIIKHELFNNHRKYIAVGEIGIDLYWDKTFISEQTESFKTQIELAIKKIDFDIKDKEILILGAGGVVPSIIFALTKMKVSKIKINICF